MQVSNGTNNTRDVSVQEWDGAEGESSDDDRPSTSDILRARNM